MTITTIDVAADSEGAGTLFSYNQWAGGLGNWTELTAQRLGNIAGVGPLLSPGVRFVGSGIGPFPTDWSFAGSWTTVLSTDAFDRLPLGYGKYGTGATLIATWPKPTLSQPIVGFDYWWVDIAGGGNVSYSLDGGSSWTNFAETIVGDNHLSKCYIPSAITSNGFKVRMANAAGTGVLGFPAGITPYYSDPRSAQTGIILNNMSVNGGRLSIFVAATSGDRMAAIGSVRLGTGSPISSDPNLTLMLFVNDIQAADATTWGTNLTTWYTKAAPFGPVVFMKPWLLETTDYNSTQQALYATKTDDIATATGALKIDMNAAWTGLGFTTLVAQGAAFLQDDLHPKQQGFLDIANRVYWFVRNNLFSSLSSTPSSYTAIGKQAAVVYAGKQATVAYAAGQPVSVVPV